MLIDYHMHTPLCGHAEGEPGEYIERALQIKLAEIGFSDHNPMPRSFDDKWRMRPNQIERYIELVEDAQARYADKIPVKLGIECDFRPGTEEFVRDTINQHRFDYVIGSVHYIGEWVFDSPDELAEWERRDVFEAWRDYFDLVTQAANAGMFDIMAHPDLCKKFGHIPKQDCTALFEGFLAAVKKNDLTLEISTAGLRKPVKQIYPSLDLLKIARRLDIPISLASDAHKPGEVGHAFDQAVSLARSVGYTHIARFAKRKRELVPLG
jgi:histidinol-phosphatase (PHP family)